MSRIKEEIRFYENLFNKAFSVTVLIGAGTLTLLHKEGFTFWSGIGIVAFYWSLVFTGITLKKWKEKISLLEESNDSNS